ncbi:signal peptide-containing protein [Cryptosporidium canis]|uniref:Signal peptide-containing protein n=1 Tax=Cryptosporidium canis TaxID=195482 RepID=A0A9D5DKJ9_9CRYT|nr:signal peptide-containing protein [Cryptosporidium canis]
MNSIILIFFSLNVNIILNWLTFHTNGNTDIVSVESCRNLCKGGKVFNPFIPPKEPDCGSFVSCKKCNYDTLTKKNDPSSVCSYVFSNNFISTDMEDQLTLFHGKSQLIIPHNSTLSLLSKENNVLDENQGEKKHGLFTVAVNWERLKGVNASQCSNGIAEVEWSLFNIGTYRNWDIVAIIETKPEATFPFCFENVEFPLDGTRSSKIGSKVPTNLKRLGYTIANGRSSAVRITKTIAVNQKEMKLDPIKAMEILLKKYVSFKISISGASVRQIYSETFHESKKKEIKCKRETAGDSNSSELTSSDSDISSDTDFVNKSGDNSASINKSFKGNKADQLKRLLDTLRGKGYMEPLILDSMMSLGFYSCFRVICTKKKSTRSRESSKLEKRIPLSIDSARKIHSLALSQLSNDIPHGHTVPLPIFNSEYWVHGIYRQQNNNALKNDINILSLKCEDNKLSNTNNNIEDTINSEDSESSSSFSDLLAMIAFTNSETHQNGVNAYYIVDLDPIGKERDD